MAEIPLPIPNEGDDAPTAVVGRYAIYDAIAAGGMATVHLGRLIGEAGFLRTVAIKRLHAQFANDQDFTSMLLDEARLAARVQHPNVVPTLDVVVDGNELLLVMEYVRGVSLSQLTRAAREQGIRLPARVVVSIISGALQGLHAAHEATDEKGMPLDLVHRDVSPQNVLIGVDGTARVLDFGIAKAAGRVHTTRDGEIKGKILYMSPEQLAAEPLTRATDIYAAGILLFESLTNVRMFAGAEEKAAISKIIKNVLRMPSSIAPELAPFDAVVRRASAGEVAARYPSAAEMSAEIESIMSPASAAEVGGWVRKLGAELLDQRAKMVAHVERSSTRSKPPPASVRSGSALPTAAQLADQMSGPLSSGQIARAAMVAAAAPSSGRLGVAAASSSGTYSSTSAPFSAGDSAEVPTALLTSPAAPDSQRGQQALPLPTAAAHQTRAPARKFVAVVVGVLLALLTVAVVAIVYLVVIAQPQTKSNQASAASSASTAAATTTSSSTVASAVASDVAIPQPTATTTTSTSTLTRPTTTTTTAAPTGNVVRPAVVVKPRINCDVPYTVDKRGHRHFIPECVQ